MVLNTSKRGYLHSPGMSFSEQKMRRQTPHLSHIQSSLEISPQMIQPPSSIPSVEPDDSNEHRPETMVSHGGCQLNDAR